VELLALVQAIVGFTAIVCLGVLLRVLGLVSRDDVRPINIVIIYVGLPAFVFGAVHGASISAGMLAAVAVAWIVFAVLLGTSLVAARLLRLERRKAGGFVLASSLGNTGYLGYPLAASLLGQAALPAAVFYDVFGTVLQLVLVGFPVARRFGGGPRLTAARLVRELATFPALAAALAALLLSPVAVPQPLSDWLDLVASMVSPLIMLSVGISLRPRSIARAVPVLSAVVALKLVLAPVIAALIGNGLIAEPMAYRTVLLSASMPSMMLTLAVGQRFGLDDEFIASAVFVTTALAVVSVPLGQVLLG
jgi:predicted permease